MNDRKNPSWFDYSFFDEVKEMFVVPNKFFAFAPNNRSWHGAAIVPAQMIGVPKNSRRTFLGFITGDSDHFHHFNHQDWANNEFYLK
jgi:hypothetical protein